MNIKFISSILFVEDIKISRQFYEGVLGQTVDIDFGVNVSYTSGFSLWQRDHAWGVIFGAKQPGSNPACQPEVELGFETAHIDEAIRCLDAAGVKYEHPLIEQPWGQRTVRFYDPDQHLIELGELMSVVIARFLSQGLSIEQAAQRTGMPLEIVRQTAADPYTYCPTYQTARFAFRMVRHADAQDLLDCYSDPASAPLFNSDNCTSNFIYHTLDEMHACIQFWLNDYERRLYVRFSILAGLSEEAVDCREAVDCLKAIGTIEFFAKPGEFDGFGRVGLLRLDLASRYETQDHIAEIVQLVENQFYDLFQVDSIITKAVPEAAARIHALESAGYRALPANTIVPYADYYARVKL
jgi:catechol 2,3-dioxygenase-like lactoylglutathione lyase family enzyme/RimJ/RimL family protein N-acetyltransferase